MYLWIEKKLKKSGNLLVNLLSQKIWSNIFSILLIYLYLYKK